MKRKTIYKITLLIVGIITFTGCTGCGRKTNVESQQETKPAIVHPTAASESKPTVNVYIENSGSMDGYVGIGKTDFKSAVYNYLSDIKISDITDSLNLFYINSNIIPHRPDISDFIEKLNPTTFRQRGGNRGTTDISNLIETLLRETQENAVSILISDFIFSPGRNRDAEEYLINQQIGIKTNIAEVLKIRNLGIIVYQLSSEFNGFYYNREDRPTKIENRRPFYIWIIGNVPYITELHQRIPAAKFKGSGVENAFTIMQGNQIVDYAIRPGTGKFSLDKKSPKTKIVSVKKDHNGKLTFAVNVDFSKLLLEDEYLKNKNNYTLNDKDYQLQITNSPASAHNYTQSLNLTSDKVKPSNLSIKLNMFVPEWVELMNDNEGLDINTNEAMSKTYGIKYLINGVYEAFTQKDNFYTEVKININN